MEQCNPRVKYFTREATELLGLQQGCREAKMQEKGELPEQSLDEFINRI